MAADPQICTSRARFSNVTYDEWLIYSTAVVVEEGIGSDGCISPPAMQGIGWPEA